MTAILGAGIRGHTLSAQQGTIDTAEGTRGVPALA